MSIVDISKQVLRVVDDNSPLILTGLSVAGLVSTTVLTVRGTFKATDALREAEYNDKGLFVQLDKKERLKLIWQYYIPAASMGTITIACVIGAQSINSRRQAALISGFTLAEGAFREYREKVTEHLGAKNEKKVRDEIAADHVEKTPVTNQLVITGSGDVLCYDTNSGHYFNCDMETLRKAQNDINLQCINSMYASQNDFYHLIGLPSNKYGEEFGWTTDNIMDLQFSAVMSDDGRPCMSIDYRTLPIRGYHKVG